MSKYYEMIIRWTCIQSSTFIKIPYKYVDFFKAVILHAFR